MSDLRSGALNFEFHTIGGNQKLDAIMEAFRAQPVSICGEDQLLKASSSETSLSRAVVVKWSNSQMQSPRSRVWKFSAQRSGRPASPHATTIDNEGAHAWQAREGVGHPSDAA
jgi:hypothetical protein